MKPNYEKAKEFAINSLEPEYHLIFIDNFDKFDKETLEKALKFKKKSKQWEYLRNQLEESYYNIICDESRAILVSDEIIEKIPQEFLESLSEEEKESLADEIVQEIEARDVYGLDSYIQELLKNSGYVWVSNSFLLENRDNNQESIYIEHENQDEEMECISKALYSVSFDALDHENQKRIQSLWENATFGGLLCKITSEKAENVFNSRDDIHQVQTCPKIANIAIMDDFNGSGYDLEFKNLDATIETDNGNSYYYAEKVCGLDRKDYKASNS